MRPRNSPVALGSAAVARWVCGDAMFKPPGSNREIHAGAEFASDAGAIGAQAEIFDGDRVELLHQRFLQLLPERPDHLVAELGAGRVADRVLGILQLADDADDLAQSD